VISEAARFWRHVAVRDMSSCWDWNGTDQNEYGAFQSDAGQIGAHRYAWSFAYGTIPVGKLVLHACDRPSCVNPRHLRLGTHEDNNADKSVLSRVRATLDEASLHEERERCPIVTLSAEALAIHSNIRRLRKLRRLSQSFVASAVGVTNGAVCHWEKGKGAPSRRHLPLLAAVLGVAVDELFAVHEFNLSASPKSVTTTSTRDAEALVVQESA
jgi:DNA-binding XRE family transcriptional regulator